MRTPLDRLGHALSFEILALILVVPLGASLFGMPAHDMGVVTVVAATLATLWNMAFNYGFDRGMLRLTGSTRKSGRVRVLHALLFELGLLFVLMPFIAWYLEITLWRALILDLSVALFYMFYALAFNWAYDRLFPVPEWRRECGETT